MGADRQAPTKGTRGRIIAALGITFVAVVAAALWLTGDGPKPAGEIVSPSRSSSTETTASPAEATIEEDASAVADAIANATGAWTERVAGVRVGTVLRRPVVEVATDYDAEDAQGVEEFSSQLDSVLADLAGADTTPRTYYIRILSSGGEIVGVAARTDERWAIEGPPPPGDSQSLYAWLDSVYGSGSPVPESWFGRITAMLDPPADPEGYVVVQTTLDPSVPADLSDAQAILDAVNSSGATFAPGVRITFTDPAFEWVAMMDGVDPFGPPTQ